MPVRKHREPQISHVIPFFQLCTNAQKSQNFNDPTSNVETTGRELRATFLRNHPRPAQNGALRPVSGLVGMGVCRRQKAPSTKRCIKTRWVGAVPSACAAVRKHRAPKGALRPHTAAIHGAPTSQSDQKAPSAKRCIMTSTNTPADVVNLYRSESTERQKVH